MHQLMAKSIQKYAVRRVSGVEAVAAERRHVDITLQAPRATEQQTVIEQLLADTLHFIAYRAVEGQRLAGSELEVGEDDDEVDVLTGGFEKTGR
ncbi:MAG: hypothetical protein ABS96_28870 [Lysobacteraceae bacterium SCN 69-123]|nr:MAG: hypothetical protein ABS96_28870 [Xanthomonadaceae bacterium SCN 69-123]